MKLGLRNLIFGVLCLNMLWIGSAIAGTFGDFTYTVLGDNTIEISDYTGAGGDVIIPEAIDGTNVTSIGDHAFDYSFYLKFIELPNSLTNIGNAAFHNCSSLTFIDLPNAVNNIGISAFSNCDSLTNLLLGANVSTISDFAFHGCASLSEIELPTSVTNIADGAFYDCTGLTSIVFGNVTSIGDHAFFHCSALRSVVLPSSLRKISDDAFSFCLALKSVCFNGDAPTTGTNIFKNYPLEPSLVKVFYRSSASGFGSTFGDRPTALIPEFTNMTLTATNMVMNTLGTDGEVYVLQSCTNLTQGAWTSLETNTVSGGGVEFNLPTQGEGKFYRVVIEL